MQGRTTGLASKRKQQTPSPAVPSAFGRQAAIQAAASASFAMDRISKPRRLLVPCQSRLASKGAPGPSMIHSLPRHVAFQGDRHDPTHRLHAPKAGHRLLPSPRPVCVLRPVLRLPAAVLQAQEYFYDWCEIGSLYGAPADCIWGGGRVGAEGSDPQAAFALTRAYGISARLTFSNSLLRKEHLADARCNALCRLLAENNQPPNGVIVH